MPLPKAKSSGFFRSSFFIFIIRFFPSLANLLVLILYSRQLPEAVNGNYQHFWIQMNVIYPLACFGIHVLAITYSKGFITSVLQRLKTSHYVIYTIWLVLLSAVFAMLQYSALNISFIVPFLFIFSFSLSIIFESFLIVFQNYKILTVINVLYSVAYYLIHVYVLHNGFSLQSLFVLLLGIAVLRFCIYCILLAMSVKQDIPDNDTETIDVVKIRSLWLHLGLYDVLQILFASIDKFIISLVLIAPLSAIYYNGSQNIPFLPLLLSAAGSAVLIQVATTAREDESANLAALMNQSGRILSCIVFPVFFFLFLFRNEIITGLFSDKYLPAVPVFAMSVLVLPVRAYSFTTVLQRMHKGNLINIGAVADLLLACGLMYPLYLWLGLPGVALSFVITTYLQAAFYLFYSARLLHMNPFQLIPYVNWLVKFIVFATLFIGIRYVGSQYFTVEITLILGGALMVVLMAASLLMEFQRQKKWR